MVSRFLTLTEHFTQWCWRPRSVTEGNGILSGNTQLILKTCESDGHPLRRSEVCPGFVEPNRYHSGGSFEIDRQCSVHDYALLRLQHNDSSLMADVSESWEAFDPVWLKVMIDSSRATGSFPTCDPEENFAGLWTRWNTRNSWWELSFAPATVSCISCLFWVNEVVPGGI